MRYKIIYIALLLLTTVFYGQAQKEAWHWAFGQNAGLSFHPDNLRSLFATGYAGTGVPNETLHNLPGTFTTLMSALEGVFSISDKEGNLLFYSNGMEIWKADGEQIFSGLQGHPSSAQSGIVVPYPGDNKKYICIGLSQTNTGNMNYVIVQANSPTDVSVLGNSVAFSGHTGTLGESMSAIRHGNGRDWWIVAAGKGRVSFNAWLATPAGVESSAPKKITDGGGTVINPALSNGYLKFTSDGKHFVFPTWTGGRVFYGDFNDLTGEFSNIRTLTGERYGAEFSPNLKYLYLSATSETPLDAGLYVWDFEALLQGTAITPIKYIAASSGFAALQLDPFGRIWAVMKGLRSMYIIDNPDDPANLKLYMLRDFLPTGTLAQYGLPSFSASWFNLSVIEADSEEFCANTSQSFSVNVTKGSGVNELSHTEWDFGDGSAVKIGSNEDGTQTYTHTYAKQGRYTITVKCFRSGDGSEVTELRKTLEVTVNPCMIPVNPNVHLFK